MSKYYSTGAKASLDLLGLSRRRVKLALDQVSNAGPYAGHYPSVTNYKPPNPVLAGVTIGLPLAAGAAFAAPGFAPYAAAGLKGAGMSGLFTAGHNAVTGRPLMEGMPESLGYGLALGGVGRGVADAGKFLGGTSLGQRALSAGRSFFSRVPQPVRTVAAPTAGLTTAGGIGAYMDPENRTRGFLSGAGGASLGGLASGAVPSLRAAALRSTSLGRTAARIPGRIAAGVDAATATTAFGAGVGASSRLAYGNGQGADPTPATPVAQPAGAAPPTRKPSLGYQPMSYLNLQDEEDNRRAGWAQIAQRNAFDVAHANAARRIARQSQRGGQFRGRVGAGEFSDPDKARRFIAQNPRFAQGAMDMYNRRRAADAGQGN